MIAWDSRTGGSHVGKLRVLGIRPRLKQLCVAGS